MNNVIKFKKLVPEAVIPKYATEGAACFDLVSLDGAIVEVGTSVKLSTGLACEIPEGKALMIYSRSGHGFKSGVRLCNCVGVLDSDYRGEIGVKLTNDGTDNFVVHAGDRIAQAMLIDAPHCELIEVEELSDTTRGVGGFGSTGK